MMIQMPGFVRFKDEIIEKLLNFSVKIHTLRFVQRLDY